MPTSGSLRAAAGKSIPVLVGFAAETENLLDNARAKLAKKRVDAIVLNDVSRADIGFNSDLNAVTIVTASRSCGGSGGQPSWKLHRKFWTP